MIQKNVEHFGLPQNHLHVNRCHESFKLLQMANTEIYDSKNYPRKEDKHAKTPSTQRHEHSSTFRIRSLNVATTLTSAASTDVLDQLHLQQLYTNVFS